MLKRGVTMNSIPLIVKNVNYSHSVLHARDFSNTTFINCNFDRCDLTSCNFTKSVFKQCSLRFANLHWVNFSDVDLRNNTLKGSNLRGANFHFALLEQSDLRDVIFDDTTKFFGNTCPKEGYFIGYKKCFNYRIVKLLIPKDARRSSATNAACRCDKARVLSITSIDETKSYREATSLNTSAMVYRVNEMVYPDSFNEDPWNDSTHGIHFFMTRKQAIDY